MNNKSIDQHLDAFTSGSRELLQYCKANNITSSSLRAFGKKCLGGTGWDTLIRNKKRKQTPYQLGRSFEYSVRNIFKNSGWYVFRSAQSKGAADLIVLQRGKILFVQCKRGGGIDKTEKTDLLRICDELGVTAIIAERPDGRTTQLWKISQDKHGTIHQSIFKIKGKPNPRLEKTKR